VGAATKMNIFELYFLVLALALSFILGRYLFNYLGWWSVLPAVFLGFGLVALVLIGIRKIPLRRPPASGPK